MYTLEELKEITGQFLGIDHRFIAIKSRCKELVDARCLFTSLAHKQSFSNRQIAYSLNSFHNHVAYYLRSVNHGRKLFIHPKWYFISDLSTELNNHVKNLPIHHVDAPTIAKSN